jgi:MraZ protein
MLLGQHHLFLDKEYSVAFPQPLGQVLADGVYVTRGFEQDLLIMSEKVFQEIYERVVALNLTDPVARLLLRLILGHASRLEVDSSGRMRIPPDLADFAGLEKEIILVGQGDYCEVWAPAQWERQAANLRDVEANADRFAQLDLALS